MDAKERHIITRGDIERILMSLRTIDQARRAMEQGTDPRAAIEEIRHGSNGIYGILKDLPAAEA